MAEKPTLLYCSRGGEGGISDFASGIARANRPYEYKFAETVKRPFRCLDDVDGIVFVGPQTSQKQRAVFSSYQDYFDFIGEAHSHGLSIAAVLNRPFRLPGGNKGIDYLIETEKGERTIKSIAEELAEFFNIALMH